MHKNRCLRTDRAMNRKFIGENKNMKKDIFYHYRTVLVRTVLYQYRNEIIRMYNFYENLKLSESTNGERNKDPMGENKCYHRLPYDLPIQYLKFHHLKNLNLGNCVVFLLIKKEELCLLHVIV